MKELINILDLICCISITAILVAIAIMALILMCKAIIEVIDEWRRLSSLDDERSNKG
nr:MAG TPA: hypothetical protein [Bacteriophage sp.]